MRRIYKIFLALYPRRYRELFGDEISRVFEDAFEEHRGRGWMGLIAFLMLELGGAIKGAGAGWISRLGGAPAANSINSLLPDEVAEAQKCVQLSLDSTIYAISHHQFEQARYYSNQERMERERLREIAQKYGLDFS